MNFRPFFAYWTRLRRLFLHYNVVCIFLLFPLSLLANPKDTPTYSSISSGDWGAASTWSKPDWASLPPSGGQSLIVNTGDVVTCNGDISGMGAMTINGTLIVNGNFTSSNNLVVGPSGSLIVSGNFTPCDMDISGKVSVGGAFSYTCGSADVESTGTLIINGTGNFDIQEQFNVEGKVLISGSVTLTGGSINLNQSGLLAIGKDLSIGSQNLHLSGSSSKLLVQGNMTTTGDNLTKASGAQIAVLGDLNITNWNHTALGCTTDTSSPCSKPSQGCTSCQILDTIDPTNPDWQIPAGITALWWEDFNDNSDGTIIETPKWQVVGNDNGYRSTSTYNKQLCSSKIQSQSSSVEVWESTTIDISCYQNVNISCYTLGSYSVNNLYYRVDGTENWIQVPRSASGYNRVTGLSGNTIQLSWWVSGDASTCTLDNVGVFGTAMANCSSSGAPLSVMTTHQDASCEGKNDGLASVSVSGGTGSYTYSWSPSGGNNAVATGLAAGNYTVTVTSGHSVTASLSIKSLHQQVSTGSVSKE